MTASGGSVLLCGCENGEGREEGTCQHSRYYISKGNTSEDDCQSYIVLT